MIRTPKRIETRLLTYAALCTMFAAGCAGRALHPSQSPRAAKQNERTREITRMDKPVNNKAVKNGRMVEEAWIQTERANTIEAYEAFRNEYQGSTRADAANTRVELLRRAKLATSVTELENILDEYPGDGKILVPQIENEIIRQIQDKGPGDRLIIQGVKSREGSRGRITFIELKTPGLSLRQGSVFPGDHITGDPMAVPLEDGSIHRFNGRKGLTLDGVTCEFEGAQDSRYLLTFAVVKNVGYVYLRGKGKVRTPDGKVTYLGHLDSSEALK